MLSGILLSALFGASLSAINALLGNVAARKLAVFPFYFTGYSFAAGMAWALLPDWHAAPASSLSLKMVFCVVCAGVATTLGMAAAVRALAYGTKSLSVAMLQSSMALPFLFSIFVFGESPRASKLFGLSLLTASVASLAMIRAGRKEKGKEGGLAWLAPLSIAIFLNGAAQCAFLVTSKCGWPDILNIRVPVFLSTGAAVSGAIVLAKKQALCAGCVKFGFLWSLLSLSANAMCFKSLDALAGLGAAGLVFPLAVGISVAGVSIYGWVCWGERLGASSTLWLFAGFAGMAMLFF